MQQQDDFMKLYEEYMDEDEIQSIIEADEIEELQEPQGKVNKSTKKKNIDALSAFVLLIDENSVYFPLNFLSVNSSFAILFFLLLNSKM